MEIESIKDGDKILVLILRNGDFAKDLNFYTKDEDFIQVSTWNYNKGKKTIPHSHKISERTSNKSQEVLYIKKGKIKSKIYNEKEIMIKEAVLNAGDTVIIFGGGHSYEILEGDTQVLEVKNGPYPGLEKDKKVINLP